jgi:hypothetical protein
MDTLRAEVLRLRGVMDLAVRHRHALHKAISEDTETLWTVAEIAQKEFDDAIEVEVALRHIPCEKCEGSGQRVGFDGNWVSLPWYQRATGDPVVDGDAKVGRCPACFGRGWHHAQL